MRIKLLAAVLLSLGLSFGVGAQSTASTYGKVTYDYYVDMDHMREGLQRMKSEKPQQYALHSANGEEMYAFMDAFTFELLFTANESFFTRIDDYHPTDVTDNMNYTTAKVLATSGNDTYYLDRKAGVRLRRKTLEGAQVNITSAYRKYNWELTGASKQLKGRTLLEAKTKETFVDSKDQVQQKIIYAWYAPDIPVPYGPLGYDGLPGLILKLRFGETRSMGINATVLELSRVAPKSGQQLKKPPAAAEMTEAEYEVRATEARRRRDY
jgi:GLPGLI family protein